MKNKYLLAILAMSLLSGCSLMSKEGHYIIVDINDEHIRSVEVMDENGNISEFKSNELGEEFEPGDWVTIKYKDDQIISIKKESSVPIETVSSTYEKFTDIPEINSFPVFTKNEIIDTFTLDPNMINDGIMIMSNNEEILTFLYIEGPQPEMFKNIFNDLIEGIEATYDKSLEDIDPNIKVIEKYEDEVAYLIVAKENTANKIASLIND